MTNQRLVFTGFDVVLVITNYGIVEGGSRRQALKRSGVGGDGGLDTSKRE